MTYCTAVEVAQLTGLKPEHLRLEKGDNEGLETLLTKWILQCKGLIDAHCHTTFDTDTPEVVKNVCLRLTANMVAFAQTRKDTPYVKVNEWNVQVSSFTVFSQDLKDDLKEFVVDKSNKSDKVDFGVISGDDPIIED